MTRSCQLRNIKDILDSKYLGYFSKCFSFKKQRTSFRFPPLNITLCSFCWQFPNFPELYTHMHERHFAAAKPEHCQEPILINLRLIRNNLDCFCLDASEIPRGRGSHAVDGTVGSCSSAAGPSVFTEQGGSDDQGNLQCPVPLDLVFLGRKWPPWLSARKAVFQRFQAWKAKGACPVAAVTEHSGHAWEGFKSASALFCTLYCHPRSLPYSENYLVVQSWAPSTVTHAGASLVSCGGSAFSVLNAVLCRLHF